MYKIHDQINLKLVFASKGKFLLTFIYNVTSFDINVMSTAKSRLFRLDRLYLRLYTCS